MTLKITGEPGRIEAKNVHCKAERCLSKDLESLADVIAEILAREYLREVELLENRIKTSEE